MAPSTRDAIERAIHRLGYEPDRAGRMLNSRRRREPFLPPSGMPRLTVVGYLCADLTARLPALPAREARATASSIQKTLGGAAANVAVVAAGLGEPLALWVELMTVLGTDPESDWAADILAERGVALTPGSRRQDAALSRCIVLVDAQGGRTIVNERLAVAKADLLRWLDAVPAGHRRHCLHVQGDQLEELLDVLPEIRRRGLLLAFHTPGLPAARCSRAGLNLIASLFDLVLLDGEVAGSMIGCTGGPVDLVRAFAALLGPDRLATVVLTLEAEGAALLEPGSEPVLVPAEPVTPVDRTGAGDCFAGIFLAAWLCGRSAATACRLAVLGASRSVLVPGAQEYRPKAGSLLDLPSAEAV